MCIETNTVMHVFEKEKGFIERLTCRETGKAQICLSDSRLWRNWRGQRNFKLGSWLASPQLLRCWKLKDFSLPKGLQRQLTCSLRSVDWSFLVQGRSGDTGSYLAHAHCCFCKVTQVLIIQQPDLREQNPFKLVRVSMPAEGQLDRVYKHVDLEAGCLH